MHHNRVGLAISVTAAVCLWSSAARAQGPTVGADAFVASVGVNLHLHHRDTPYGNFPMVRSRLLELGVRHVRDGLIDTTWRDYYAYFDTLAGDGIKATFIVAPKPEQIELWKQYPSRMPRAFEAYEAPNELDNSGDPNWAQTLRQTMVSMGELRSGPFPVIGPSLTRVEAYQALGDVSAYFDAGNIHNYMGGRHPGTPGWNGDYGSIGWNVRLQQQYSGGKPIVATENGYHNQVPTPESVPPDVAGIYMPRLLMEQYRAGIARTYIYELVDSEGVDGYGLLNRDFSPKPAFNAVSGLLTLLSDPGPAFTPQPLGHGVQGGTSDVRHMVFQKRDGTFLVALWLEVSSFDQETRQRLTVAPQGIAVTLPSPMRYVGLHRWDANGSRVSTPVAGVTTASVPVTVSEYLTVIQLAPHSPGAIATVPGVPGTLSASVDNRSVLLRWQPPIDGGAPSGYVIEAGSAASPGLPITLQVGNANELHVPNVAPGVYAARVRAFNGHGPGSPGNTIQFAVGVPGPPALAPAHVAGQRVALAWTPGPGEAPSSYTLVVGTTAGASNVGVFPMGRATTIAANSPIAGTLYAYVVAHSPAGIAASNMISFNVSQPGHVPAPTMRPAIVSGSFVRLSWTPVGGATSYVLVARNAFTGHVVATLPLTAQALDVPGAPRGTYSVSVVALAGAQRSAESNAVAVVVP